VEDKSIGVDLPGVFLSPDGLYSIERQHCHSIVCTCSVTHSHKACVPKTCA